MENPQQPPRVTNLDHNTDRGTRRVLYLEITWFTPEISKCVVVKMSVEHLCAIKPPEASHHRHNSGSALNHQTKLS